MPLYMVNSLSLHDALPIWFAAMATKQGRGVSAQALDKSQLLHMYEQMKTIREFEERASKEFASGKLPGFVHLDRKSTRLNSSHVSISYAVFCLKKHTQMHL